MSTNSTNTEEKTIPSTREKKMSTYQLTATALMAAVMCILGPMSIPIGAVPISLTNLVICFAVLLLGPKFGTLSVLVYLLLGTVGLPVFSGYGAGLAKLAGPTGGYLIGFIPMAIIGGLFIEKSRCQPVISALGLILGIAVCYAFGTAWFIWQMECTLGYALGVCVFPFIPFDLCKVVLAVAVCTPLRSRLEQAGLLRLA